MLVTRYSYEVYRTWRDYSQELYALWVDQPLEGLLQVIILIIAWTHGSIGLYYWLRLRSFFPRIRALLLPVAVLLPVLALLGFAQGSRKVAELSQDAQWRAETLNVDAMVRRRCPRR